VTCLITPGWLYGHLSSPWRSEFPGILQIFKRIGLELMKCYRYPHYRCSWRVVLGLILWTSTTQRRIQKNRSFDNLHPKFATNRPQTCGPQDYIPRSICDGASARYRAALWTQSPYHDSLTTFSQTSKNLKFLTGLAMSGRNSTLVSRLWWRMSERKAVRKLIISN